MALEAMRMVGVTAQELSDALLKVPWPPISEKDIQLIQMNMSLNNFEKRYLIHQIGKYLDD